MKRHLNVIAMSLAAVVLAATSAAAAPLTDGYEYAAPKPGTYSLPVVKKAADGEVIDPEGRPHHLRELIHGRVTVMSFIYTRCAAAKACPYATGVLMQLHRASEEDPALTKGLRLISMSFDPAGDTPERMKGYSALATSEKPRAEWFFLTTASQEKLSPILEAYGQAVGRKSNPLDPTGPLNHVLRVFLIDREGRIRNIYSSDTLDPRLVLADIKTLLAEQAGSGELPVAPKQAADRGAGQEGGARLRKEA
jgi:cytochrome oxidase Cu insertion factor (SCO1/SenC/PrrC family)